MGKQQQQYDLTILGGGLAGLSLALHCHQEVPNIRIAVLEKNRHPAPEAAFKVGESTVEVATHYFQNVLGLREHLQQEQLPKLGLRFFFAAGDNRAIENRLELGGSEFPPTPSFQLDRGRFENFLAERCKSLGIDFVDGANVKHVDLQGGRKHHHVRYQRADVDHQIESRWVADCSGRAAILKRKLGLEKEITHRANAAWFRVGAEIRIDDWSSDPAWKENYDRDQNPRWLSTNHLMGKGYWVWLIPLSSGCTSVGIVADEDTHSLSDFNSLEKALAWLDKYEPQCAEKIRQHEDQVQDFLAIKRYSRETKQVFSANRWGVTGEAGFFLDPFYSPGSDFIGYGNTFMVDLIKRDFTGRGYRMQARIYDFFYKRMHYGTAHIYQDQYQLFGNQQVMPIKILWDYMIYWSLPGHMFCHNRILALGTFARNFRSFKRLHDLNRFMQKFFRQWHQETQSWEATGEIDSSEMKVIVETNRALMAELDDKAYGKRFAHSAAQMETLAAEIIEHSGIKCKPPFKRRKHDNVIGDSFAMLFEATMRRFEESPATDNATFVS